MSNEQQKIFVQSPVANNLQPLILAIETATRAGSVSVARGETILASTGGDPAASHSTDLIENVDAVLREASTQLGAVDLFAVAAGPGSFTGLRIGIATVKSFAVALKRRCAAVPTLAAVAYAAGRSERTVALLPAGRGEVFAQMFSVNDKVETLDQASHISPAALLGKYGAHQRVVWAGEGAHLQFELLKNAAEERRIKFHDSASEQLTDGWAIAPPQNRLADAVAMLALQLWRADELVNAEDLHADYVRPSDAEIKSHA
jgi:tRNA threonylcarbamoyladenosine biosynthesis protein TsaB